MPRAALLPRELSQTSFVRIGGGVLLAGSVAFIGERLWKLDWSSLQPHISWQFGWALVGANILFAAADIALAKGWALMADPERKLSAFAARNIYGRGVLMKYLPGSVFQYLGRQLGGVNAGLRHGDLVRSSAGEIGLHVIASMTVAAACLFMDKAPLATSVAMTVLILGCLLVRRAISTALVYQLLAFAAFGAAAALIGAAVLPADLSLARFAAFFLLAWLAGFVVPVAPGGLGIREAALIMLATGAVPAADLIAATVVLRVASTSGDVVFGLAALRPARAA